MATNSRSSPHRAWVPGTAASHARAQKSLPPDHDKVYGCAVTVAVQACGGRLVELDVSIGDAGARRSAHPLGTRLNDLGAFFVEVIYHAGQRRGQSELQTQRDDPLGQTVSSRGGGSLVIGTDTSRAVTMSPFQQIGDAATAVQLAIVAPELAKDCVLRAEQTHRADNGVITVLIQVSRAAWLEALYPGLVLTFPSCLTAHVHLQQSAQRAASAKQNMDGSRPVHAEINVQDPVVLSAIATQRAVADDVKHGRPARYQRPMHTVVPSPAPAAEQEPETKPETETESESEVEVKPVPMSELETETETEPALVDSELDMGLKPALPSEGGADADRRDIDAATMQLQDSPTYGTNTPSCSLNPKVRHRGRVPKTPGDVSRHNFGSPVMSIGSPRTPPFPFPSRSTRLAQDSVPPVDSAIGIAVKFGTPVTRGGVTAPKPIYNKLIQPVKTDADRVSRVCNSSWQWEKLRQEKILAKREQMRMELECEEQIELDKSVHKTALSKDQEAQLVGRLCRASSPVKTRIHQNGTADISTRWPECKQDLISAERSRTFLSPPRKIKSKELSRTAADVHERLFCQHRLYQAKIEHAVREQEEQLRAKSIHKKNRSARTSTDWHERLVQLGPKRKELIDKAIRQERRDKELKLKNIRAPTAAELARLQQLSQSLRKSWTGAQEESQQERRSRSPPIKSDSTLLQTTKSYSKSIWPSQPSSASTSISKKEKELQKQTTDRIKAMKVKESAQRKKDRALRAEIAQKRARQLEIDAQARANQAAERSIVLSAKKMHEQWVDKTVKVVAQSSPFCGKLGTVAKLNTKSEIGEVVFKDSRDKAAEGVVRKIRLVDMEIVDARTEYMMQRQTEKIREQKQNSEELAKQQVAAVATERELRSLATRHLLTSRQRLKIEHRGKMRQADGLNPASVDRSPSREKQQTTSQKINQKSLMSTKSVGLQRQELHNIDQLVTNCTDSTSLVLQHTVSTSSIEKNHAQCSRIKDETPPASSQSDDSNSDEELEEVKEQSQLHHEMVEDETPPASSQSDDSEEEEEEVQQQLEELVGDETTTAGLRSDNGENVDNEELGQRQVVEVGPHLKQGEQNPCDKRDAEKEGSTTVIQTREKLQADIEAKHKQLDIAAETNVVEDPVFGALLAVLDTSSAASTEHEAADVEIQDSSSTSESKLRTDSEALLRPESPNLDAELLAMLDSSSESEASQTKHDSEPEFEPKLEQERHSESKSEMKVEPNPQPEPNPESISGSEQDLDSPDLDAELAAMLDSSSDSEASQTKHDSEPESEPNLKGNAEPEPNPELSGSEQDLDSPDLDAELAAMLDSSSDSEAHESEQKLGAESSSFPQSELTPEQKTSKLANSKQLQPAPDIDAELTGLIPTTTCSDASDSGHETGSAAVSGSDDPNQCAFAELNALLDEM